MVLMNFSSGTLRMARETQVVLPKLRLWYGAIIKQREDGRSRESHLKAVTAPISTALLYPKINL